MKRALIALFLLAAAATPALAQNRDPGGYDAQADADRTRATLNAYGAQYDAQAANAAAFQAQSQATIRRIEADRNQPPIRPQVYDPQAAATAADADAAAAQHRASDAALRNLDAQLQQMDAYLDQARPK
jgi:hypothetical protein